MCPDPSYRGYTGGAHPLNQLPRTHDLLGPLRPGVVLAEEHAQQEDAERWLFQGPFVVVRRAAPRRGWIPVGVRGVHREERCAGWIAQADVTAVHVPESLRVGKSVDFLPAYHALSTLERRWANLPWAWGPVGSVGFSLATGVQRVHERSDLDLILRMPNRPSAAQLNELASSLPGLACPVEMQVETSFGNVALAELTQGSGPFLLRAPDASVLVDDPWSAPLSRQSLERVRV